MNDEACSYPRQDPKRPVCGRPVTAWYVSGDDRLARCASHDTDLARRWAESLGIIRLPVVRAGDPLSVSV